MELRYRVPPEQAGKTLQSLMKHELRLSTARIRQLKAADGFLVDGKPVWSSHRLQAGEELCLTLTEPPPEFPEEAGELRILYEDAQLLAVDKPQGVIVHPTHSRYTGTLANVAWRHIRSGGGEGCHLVNRLDRDTGGVVLFAKNAWACSRMADAIEEKAYLAVVCGEAEASGSITLPVRREAEGGLRRICAPDGSAARTDYVCLARRGGLSLLRLRLYTGRTHQIRVHCASQGWPLLGDRLYGTPDSLKQSEALGETQQALWCMRMRFRHPLTGERLTAELATPQKVLDYFRFSC